MFNIECLFGFHKYTIPSKIYSDVLICENCRRAGYLKYPSGVEVWYDFDEKTNLVHHRDSDGYEEWYNGEEEYVAIYARNSVGEEGWFDGRKWIREKPKHWIYEKCLAK